MENNMEHYITYKFWDSQGRRLAIFARPVFIFGEFDDTDTPIKAEKLHIYIIPCSKKDVYSKKFAKKMFEEHVGDRYAGLEGINSIAELSIPIENDKPKFTFLKWCEDNYFKYQATLIAAQADILWRRDEQHSNTKMRNFEFLPIKDMDEIPDTTSEN